MGVFVFLECVPTYPCMCVYAWVWDRSEYVQVRFWKKVMLSDQSKAVAKDPKTNTSLSSSSSSLTSSMAVEADQSMTTQYIEIISTGNFFWSCVSKKTLTYLSPIGKPFLMKTEREITNRWLSRSRCHGAEAVYGIDYYPKGTKQTTWLKSID